MKKEIAVVGAVLALLAFGGTYLGLAKATGTSKPGAYETVVGFTTALQKRNFYDACGYYSPAMIKGLGGNFSQGLKVPYSDQRACALSTATTESQSILFSGQPVFDKMVVGRKALTAGAPKNGYIYRVAYLQGTVYVSVQRDSDGTWRVVGVSG